MKRVFIIILVFFISVNALAQNIAYEMLDSFSNRISELQTQANGFSYMDGNDKYELSFPEENFKVWVSTRMATNAVYKKKENKEVLELTENIDLTKSISFKAYYGNNQMVCFRMMFPEGSIQTKVFEDGILSETKSDNHVDFFSTINQSKTNSNFNTWQLFNNLVYIAHSLKAEKGLFTYKIDALDKKWKETIDRYKRTEINEFITKYKYTLYAEQGQRLIEGIDEWDNERKTKRQWLLNLADSLCNVYKFKPGILYYNYKDFNPAVADVQLKYYNNGDFYGYPTASYTQKNFSIKKLFKPGFTGYMTDNENKIIHLSYSIYSEKGTNSSSKKIMADLYERLKKNTDAHFVISEEKENGNKQHIVVKIPVSAENTKISYYIVYNCFTYEKMTGISISFSTKENIATSF